jgi:tetratricopeptide (TPR) repeat protein
MTSARPLLFALIPVLALATPVWAQEPQAPPVIEPAPPPSIPEVWAPVPVDAEGRSAYGLFLAGRMAAGQGDAASGADYLRRAQTLAPEQPTLRDQAFATNLLGGDLGFAGRIAPEGGEVPAAISEVGRLVEIVQAFGAGDARGALATLEARPIARPHQRAGRLVTPFIAATAGDWDRALRPITGPATDAATVYARSHRARLLEMRRRYDDAAQEWAAATRSRLGRRLFVLDHGAFLERRGRRDEAIALYDASLAEGVVDGRIDAARARAAARRRPPAVPSLRQGASDALTAAAVQATAEGQHEFAAVYLRLAYDLVPSDATLLNLGDALTQAQLTTPGRQALMQVGPADPGLYATAQLAMAESLVAEGMDEAALDPLLRAAEVLPGSPEVIVALAGRLIAVERFDDALEVLESAPEAVGASRFDLTVLRGRALNRLGRTAEAEAQFQAALVLRPDDPATLSALGYLWVDGVRVEEGAALIARAAAALPDDRDVRNALGWSQYRLGRFEEAVATLEGAVELAPADAVANAHLGDAYWRVGRRREAHFQWYRAITLDPDAELKSQLERRLEVGLADAEPSGS